MALAQDLMGLGEAAERAARLSNGGIGPVSQAGNTTIGGAQYVTYFTSAGNATLPSPTGTADYKPLIYDDYVIHNGSSGNLTVIPPSGVTINIGATAYTAASPFTLTTLKTLQIWTGPTTTQWFGLSN